MSEPAIPFFRPHVTGREAELLAEVIASRRWSGDGPMTARASAELAPAVGGGRVLLTTSCTHALELAALLLELGPGDEVIVPAFTFPSTANAFALRGARLVFADVLPDTLCIDPAAVAAALTPRTRAICVVHYAGVPCDMAALGALAARGGATLVEDNAHGLYGAYRGRPLGSFGRLATLSFHESKNLACGEGGALVVNDPALVERAEIVREKGTNRSKFFRGEVDKYTWVDLGSSYLPAELVAGFLVAQLASAGAIQAARHRVWATYARELAGWAARTGASMPALPADTEHAAHLFYVVLPDGDRRPAFLAHLKARGVQGAFHYQPLHLSPYGRRWGGAPGDCPVTERVADALVRLPLYPDLSERDVARVIEAVTSFA